MIRKSISMMSHTGTNWNVTGDPVRANAFLGSTDGVHTVQVIYQNFVGGFGIQGTLSLQPGPEDWFWIKTFNGPTDYIPFPINQLAPTGANGGDTGSLAITFIGNFTYVRAVVVRDYLAPAPVNLIWDQWNYGQIDLALLSV